MAVSGTSTTARSHPITCDALKDVPLLPPRSEHPSLALASPRTPGGGRMSASHDDGIAAREGGVSVESRAWSPAGIICRANVSEHCLEHAGGSQVRLLFLTPLPLRPTDETSSTASRGETTSRCGISAWGGKRPGSRLTRRRTPTTVVTVRQREELTHVAG
ncbi:unnamed protein product [Diplocarpon coronariae]|nr:hypothetical protein JHW43_008948 [Diplocarpon mali]